jgi:hypothetical protein
VKKIVSLSLALILALSLTLAASATPKTTYGLRIDPGGRQLIDGAIDPMGKVNYSSNGFIIAPGSTVCYMLFYETFSDGELVSSIPISQPETVKDISIKQTWRHSCGISTKYNPLVGETPQCFWENDPSDNHIEAVELVKLGFGASEYYFLAIKIKDFNPSYWGSISGQIALTKASVVDDCGEKKAEPLKATLDIYNQIGYERALSVDNIEPEIPMFYNWGASGYRPLNLTGEQSLQFESGHYFDIDLTGQSNLLICYDEKPNDSIACAYPNNKLKFLNFNGVSFINKGILSIPVDQGSSLYVLSADGTLYKAPAKYNELEGAFRLSTRYLGKYVIADAALDIDAS